MVELVLQNNILVLNLIKQKQNFAKICIIMVIIADYLLMEKYCKFKARNKMYTFLLNIFLEVYQKNMTISSQKKHQLKKMFMIFQSFMMLLIHLLNMHKYLMVKK